MLKVSRGYEPPWHPFFMRGFLRFTQSAFGDAPLPCHDAGQGQAETKLE
jgi:hypothetical protein